MHGYFAYTRIRSTRSSAVEVVGLVVEVCTTCHPVHQTCHPLNVYLWGHMKGLVTNMR
jgi:ribosomal protein L31